jgi:hypothetical protein
MTFHIHTLRVGECSADRLKQTSLLNSCFKQISVKNAKNKKEVTIKVYARYHKDGDATEKTANMMINEAKINETNSKFCKG